MWSKGDVLNKFVIVSMIEMVTDRVTEGNWCIVCENVSDLERFSYCRWHLVFWKLQVSIFFTRAALGKELQLCGSLLCVLITSNRNSLCKRRTIQGVYYLYWSTLESDKDTCTNHARKADYNQTVLGKPSIPSIHESLGASPTPGPFENRDNGLLIFYNMNEYSWIW